MPSVFKTYSLYSVSFYISSADAMMVNEPWPPRVPTYLPPSPYKETVTKLHPYMGTHPPTYPPNTHHHPLEVVPDFFPSSIVLEGFWQHFYCLVWG